MDARLPLAILLLLPLAGCHGGRPCPGPGPRPDHAILWGEVLDLTDHPLHGAEVNAYSQNGTRVGFAFADADGCYIVDLPTAALYSARAHFVGHSDVNMSATQFENGEMVRYDFRLPRS